MGSNPTRSASASRQGGIFLRVVFEGPVVNGAPVERQSRPRPSPQTRLNPTRSASASRQGGIFLRVGFEGPVVNGAPVERQSRPRPSPQTRPNPTRSASVPPVREAFFCGWDSKGR